MVNSRHSYHVLPNDYFEATAYSEDGYIEALEMNELLTLAVSPYKAGGVLCVVV